MLPVCRRPSVTAREALDDRLRRRFGERDDRSGRVNEGVVVREENAERATPTAEQCGAIYREQNFGRRNSGEVNWSHIRSAALLGPKDLDAAAGPAKPVLA